MTIVRENNIMAMQMPISGDALWPAQIVADMSSAQSKIITRTLKKDPYYATLRYSEPIQRKMLGSSRSVNALSEAAGLNVGSIAGVVSDTIPPLAYRAMQKIIVLYGDNPKNWPDIFKFDASLKSFVEFKDGKKKLVEAGSTDIYDSIGDAVISLTPINYQKDLKLAQRDMLRAYENTADLESQKGSLETKLQTDISIKNPSAKSSGYYKWSPQKRAEIQDKIADLNAKISQAKAEADEKQKIYFTLLDEAATALKSDIKLDENQIKLAKNVNMVSAEIQIDAGEAYSAFAIALSNISAQPILKNFGKELQSLAIAAARHPRLAGAFKIRIERLTKNALFFFPNIGVGSYYAFKQSMLASKYKDITSIIVEAAEAKEEADKAAAEDAKNSDEEIKK